MTTKEIKSKIIDAYKTQLNHVENNNELINSFAQSIVNEPNRINLLSILFRLNLFNDVLSIINSTYGNNKINRDAVDEIISGESDPSSISLILTDYFGDNEINDNVVNRVLWLMQTNLK